MTGTEILATTLSSIAIIVAAGIAAWVTRRNAKDAQERNQAISAVSGYQLLTADQRTDMQTLRDELAELRRSIAANRRLARVHMAWDRMLIAKINSHVPGADIPEPPPLIED